MTMTLELAGRWPTATDVGPPAVPILIQVPALRASSRGRGRPSARRRRLRKEVRYAGYTMMSLLPVGFLLLTLGGARPADARATGPASSTSAARRVGGSAVTLSIEPTAAPASAPLASASVTFPGYLLPVDGPEDSDHAGR